MFIVISVLFIRWISIYLVCWDCMPKLTGMCALLRHSLEVEREAFINDLRPKYVLPHLVKVGILTEAEQNSILSNNDVAIQIKELCDILPTKGLAAFNSFVEALNENDAYPWLAEKLLAHKKSGSIINSNESTATINRQLRAGNVPFPVNNLLQRNTTSDIKNKLREAALDKRRWVLLHGMVGSGKSVLAAEAVRDPDLFTECFEDGVYWIGVGRIDDQSNLLYRLQLLRDMLKLSDAPILPHSEVTLSLTEKIQAFKRYIAEAIAVKKVLIVLDDVWKSFVISAFDMGCPVLVTTRDLDIVTDVSSYVSCIHVNSGLSLVESKELLSMYVKTSPDCLPKEVDDICQMFWGSPMVLSLIGAIMSSYGNKVARWKDFLIRLKTNSHFAALCGRRRHNTGEESLHKNLKDVIRLSVDLLDEEIEGYFMELAIFQEDVYIPNQVLEVLWGLVRFDAEDVMYELMVKSLIQRKEIPSRDTFVYAIHDLYLEFLKENCKDLTGLHKKMIQQYRNLCETDGQHDYGLLPDDGYIHYFIGHHLCMAEEWELFPKVFFHLGFIKNKLCIAGASDLLNDYDMYDKGFAENMDELGDFKNFIKKNAHLIKKDTDIIQLALLEPPFSKVHQRAEIEISSKPNKFYLQICNAHLVPDFDEVHITAHTEAVKCAVFCPDNRFVASAGEDYVIKVCSSSSGRELVSLHGHVDVVNCCAFNSSGNRLISSSSDGTVKIWDINTNVLGRCLSYEKKRHSFGDVQELVSDADTQCLLTFTKHQGEVMCCAFSSDDQLVISCDSNGTVLVWDPGRGDVKHNFADDNSSAIHRCAFSYDSSVVASSSGGIIRLWDLSTRKPLGQQNHGQEFVFEFCFTKDGEAIFSIAGEFVWKWSVMESSLLKKIDINANLCSLCLSPDEVFLAVGTTPDNSIRILTTDVDKVITSLMKHKHDIKKISYSNDGSKLLSASSDHEVIIWNDISKRLLNPSVTLRNILSVKLGDELIIATATSGYVNQIQVFSGNEGLLKHKSPDEEDSITAYSLSADCTNVVYGTKWGAVKVFHIDTGEVVQCLPSHLAQITYLLHMKDSSRFVTCSEDKTLRIWESPKKYINLCGHTQLVVMCALFSCDKKLLSCSNDETSRVWDTENGTQLMILCGHSLRINFCDISPDEDFMATASADRTVKLWDAASGKLIRTVKCNDCVRCCQFSPSSCSLATGEDSGSVTLWDLMTDAYLKVGNHGSWVRQIKFSEDEKYFVSVGDSIKFWDHEGNLKQTLVLPGDLEYSLWAQNDFTVFVILHNSVLYILKSIF